MKKFFIILITSISLVSFKTKQQSPIITNDTEIEKPLSCNEILKLYDEGIAIYEKGLIKFFNSLDTYLTKNPDVDMMTVFTKEAPDELKEVMIALQKDLANFTKKIDNSNLKEQFNNCKNDESFKKEINDRVNRFEKNIKTKSPERFNELINSFTSKLRQNI